MLQLGLVKGSTNFHLIYIELRHLTYVPRIGCMSKNATRDKNRHFKAHEPGFYLYRGPNASQGALLGTSILPYTW